jgi:hypothetical protein
VGNGNFEASKIFAYVYLEHAVHSPHLFVRQAMEQVCGAPAFRLAASSRGVGVMVFGDQETREQIVALSPIVFDGNTITVERHEEADNRFYAYYNAYAEIAAVDFPHENLVATVLEWEIPTATPTLRPVHSRQPTPYPRAATLNPSLLTLPWYGVGGVPEREETPLEEPAMGSAVEEEAASALAELSLVPPPNLNTGEHTESEHVSRAQKRRARRKRARDSAHKIRRSLRLKEKEEANFELPEEKAARVQQAKFDFSGASRRLRNALIF